LTHGIIAITCKVPATPGVARDNEQKGGTMTTFNDREKGFEAKYKHDQELQFKVNARRNKLLGQWAAGKMGLAGDEAEAYAKTVVAADFEKPGDDDVLQKVTKDLAAKGITVAAGDIRKEMERLLGVAKEQIAKAV
jgi:hypothetical protein